MSDEARNDGERCGDHAARIEILEEGGRDHEVRIRSLEFWRISLETKLTTYAGIGAIIGSILWKILEKYL